MRQPIPKHAETIAPRFGCIQHQGAVVSSLAALPGVESHDANSPIGIVVAIDADLHLPAL